jgi:hypothetical protein
MRNVLSALKPFLCLITILLAAMELVYPSRSGLVIVIGLQITVLAIMEIETNEQQKT